MKKLLKSWRIKMTDKKEVIQIEICRSEYKENCFNIRIGDVQGSTESSGFSKEEILSDISDEIDNLKEKKYD
jgi:hypothetical protein